MAESQHRTEPLALQDPEPPPQWRRVFHQSSYLNSQCSLDSTRGSLGPVPAQIKSRRFAPMEFAHRGGPPRCFCSDFGLDQSSFWRFMITLAIPNKNGG